MAIEQTGQNEFIAQAVAKATRVSIQTMATTGIARQQNTAIKMKSPFLKQPIFKWRSEDKCKEL